MRRWIPAAAAFLWLAPICAVAAGGLGLPVVPAIAAGALAALALALATARVLERRIGGELSRSRLLAAALVVCAAVAILRFGAFSIFMADAGRPQFSMAPQDDFRLHHSCMSAYAESARFLEEGGHNIYERALYRPGNVARQIGPLRVDPFHYPPPFLLLPQAIRIAASDFWDFRRIWFAIQAVTLASAVVGLAAWVGGAAGAVALLGGVLLLAFPHVAFTFQQGNFQITAVPLAAMAFVLLLTGARAVGGGLLAYAALAKIFPGVLLVPLLAGRRWRAAAWVAGMGTLMLAVTLATQGTRPMRDFVTTSLPEISSGAAFPQTESPQHSRVNFSAYGQTVRLRQLGVSWLTQPRGLMLTQLYGLLVVAFAAWAGWRRRFDLSRSDERVQLLLLTLGLLGLASFRSPFVGGVYGCISTLWTMGLLAAAARTPRGAAAWLAGAVALGTAIWFVPSPAAPPSIAWLWISGALVAICMGVSAAAVVVAVRAGAPRAAARPQPDVAALPV